MSDFYSMDKTESILTNYLMIGDFAVCLHHAPDEITGQELPKWYRIQVNNFKTTDVNDKTTNSTMSFFQMSHLFFKNVNIIL